MESNENVPRFIDDVEMIERKRLRVDSLGKQRWSLSERRQDSQNLAEMGVAVLEDCQSPTETGASADIKENLENRSPNLRSPHSLKRPHAKSAVVSPMSKTGSPSRTQVNRTQTKLDDCSKRHRTSNDESAENCLTKNNIKNTSRTSPRPVDEASCSIQYSKRDNHKINTIDKYFRSSAGPSCDASKSWNGGFSPRRNDSEDRIEDSDDSLADLDCPGHNFDNIERLWCVGDKNSAIEDGSDDGIARQRNSVAENTAVVTAETSSSSRAPLQTDAPLTSVSPRPTCQAHPALHNRPSFTSIPRHTTFDDDAPNEEEFTAENPSTSNEDRIPLEEIESKKLSKCPKTEKESPIMNTSQLTSVDRVIFDSTITDLDHTVALNDSDERLYFKSDDNLLKVVTDDNADHKLNNDKILNAEQLSIKNNIGEKEKIECASVKKDEKIDLNICKTSPNKDLKLTGSCEACGDKEKCCDSHSKTPVPSHQDGGMFGKLSDEVVLSILQWLPKRTIVRCMLVSRRWRRLGADSRLWARVDLGGRVLPSGSLATLMERHPVALRLANAQLTSPVIPPPMEPIERVEILKWRIQYLDLSAASVSTACLAAILGASTGLIRLSLEGLSLGEQGGKALMRLTKLKSLNLALTTGIGAALLSKRSQNDGISLWPQCESLNLSWCHLETEDLNALCELLPSALQRLNLSGCRMTMTNAMVEKIVLRCPGLVELDLSDCANLMSEGIREVLKLPALEHLALSRCYRLLLQDYVQLSGCQSLQWLDVFGLLPNLSAPILQRSLPNIHLNKFIHSSIARPTVGNRRTSIWGLRTRD